MRNRITTVIVALLVSLPFAMTHAVTAAASGYLSPTEIAASADGKTLFVACATGARVIEFDVASATVRRSFPVTDSPLGLALSRDGKELFVTCAAPASHVD